MLSCGELVRAGARAGSVQQAWDEPPARAAHGSVNTTRQRTASRVWGNELSRRMFRYDVTEYRTRVVCSSLFFISLNAKKGKSRLLPAP